MKAESVASAGARLAQENALLVAEVERLREEVALWEEYYPRPVDQQPLVDRLREDNERLQREVEVWKDRHHKVSASRVELIGRLNDCEAQRDRLSERVRELEIPADLRERAKAAHKILQRWDRQMVECHIMTRTEIDELEEVVAATRDLLAHMEGDR